MIKVINFLLLAILISSCKPNENEFAKKEDFAFITDSLNVDTLLVNNKLAGFSLTVFEDYSVVYSNQFGVRSFETDEKIDENTAFSTASISKPVTALLCHILAEKELIDLDEPIENYLKRWSLPENEHTENTKPTWKHLMNHTAGTSQHGFADFYEGDTIPSIKQSLLGQLPRYNQEIEFLFEPGTSWQYSGGGYVIIQMALEDTFQEPISELAREHIFKPLNMTNTTMKQPNEKGFLENVALVHNKDGEVIRTGLPITPQVAPSGMWSTTNDLAKLAIEIQNALRNENNRVVSHEVAKEITRTTALKNAVGGWSYGWQKTFGFDNYDWFMCNGSNTGVGGDVYATMTDGNGYVFLANGDKPNRFPVINQVRQKLQNLMGWSVEIKEDEMQEMPDELKAKLVGTYEDFLFQQPKLHVEIVDEGGKMIVKSPYFDFSMGKNSELIYLKNGFFKIIDYPNLMRFDFDDEGLEKVSLFRDDISTEIKVEHKS
ncbi:beta-lactamase family protein [Neolewinella aurantiaca]|uniref:Beta-lactamase family protein n=1 Tax=Neolewinella aurantiaca TaxID=2602767 RepID=A0A5C7FD53_9BACT|nr:serine hydrolase domain-containing protein [Neolewinella aurantiaca]TXF88631.1 beta-lactamase family protein [Neolewinella aurantiaca]